MYFCISTLIFEFFCSSTKLLANTDYRNWGSGGVSVVSTGSNSETSEINSVVSDGNGGVIVTWRDSRNGNNDIFVQKFDSKGTAQWTTNGVTITNVAGSQIKPVIASDGNGGAIIAWEDPRTDTGDVYAQRVDSTGTVQWTANGVVISATTSSQSTPMIISDGLQGAIVTWIDLRSGVDIYAQRVDSTGTVQWTANGVVISNATNTQTSPNLVSDGSNGAVIVWVDSRSGTADIYGQRINSSGSVQWTANGVVICSATGPQNNFVLTADNSFNTVVSWVDDRNGSSDFAAYVQKINSSGTVQWTANGVVIGDTTGTQSVSSIAVDGLDNTYVSWKDTRTDAGDIYIQKLNSSGTIQFASNGIAIASSVNEQSLAQLAADRVTNDVFILWYDKRITSNPNIYGQRINSSGTSQWQNNGSILSNFSSTNTVFLISRIVMGPNNNLIYDVYVSDTTFKSVLQQIVDINRYKVDTFSDQMTRINETTVSGHTIKFVSANGITPGQTIAVTLPAGFVFGSSYDFNDMVLAEGSTGNCDTATFSNKTIAGSPSGSTWGATYSSQVVTFTSGTNTITAGHCVEVILNTNGANHTLTNPTVGSDTVYNPTVVSGDQQGQAAVIILNDLGTPDSDQIEIDGSIGTIISLDLDTVVTNCANSTETSLNSVDLGVLIPGTVNKSSSTIKFICIDASTNAGLGLNLFARSNRSNAAGGLVSGGNAITSATADLTLVGTTSGYGIRVSSVGTPSLGALTINSPFNSGTSGSVGALPGILSAAAQIVDSTGPVSTGTSSRIAVEVAAKASSLTAPGSYTDIISFTVLVNF